MLAGAVRAYLNRWAVAPRRAAVFTTCDDGWRTAADLAAAGVEVDGARRRPARRGGAARAVARASRAAEVVAAHGWRELSAISVRQEGRVERLAVDCLAVAGGWNPTLHLTSHLGGAAGLGRRPRRLRAGGRGGAGAGGGRGGGGGLLDAGGAPGRRGRRRRRPGRARDPCGRRGAGGGGRSRGAGGALAGRGRPWAGVARPAERRDGEGRGPGGAGGLPLGGAHEALHHPRHGDRPGQDRRRRRARASSPS